MTEVLMALYDETETEEKSWQDFANCLGVDPDLFPEQGFHPGGQGGLPGLCRARGLPRVRPAERREVRHLGGMSERERRRIRRQRALARAAAAQAGNVTA